MVVSETELEDLRLLEPADEKVELKVVAEAEFELEVPDELVLLVDEVDWRAGGAEKQPLIPTIPISRTLTASEWVRRFRGAMAKLRTSGNSVLAIGNFREKSSGFGLRRYPPRTHFHPDRLLFH